MKLETRVIRDSGTSGVTSAECIKLLHHGVNPRLFFFSR